MNLKSLLYIDISLTCICLTKKTRDAHIERDKKLGTY